MSGDTVREAVHEAVHEAVEEAVGRTGRTVTWDDLVTTALLGTTRRPLDETLLDPRVRELLPAGEPPRRLLDAAALLAVARRAGAELLRPPLALPEPAAAPPEDPTNRVATELLLGLLATKRSPLLLEFLQTAATHGRVVAPEALPALLDAGAGDRAVADAAAPVLGARGRWLAAQRETWRPQATRAGTGHHLPWEFATVADRVAALRALRREDPTAGRDLLQGSWSDLRGEERERLLAELDAGLGAADAELLELALADRSRGVRDQAAALLARLPDSGYARRMVARARQCVTAHGPGLLVVPPRECDEGMTRDAITAGAQPGVEVRSEGVRAHWLRQVVAATPLPHWTDLTGGNPQDVLRLPVADGWGSTLREAWAEAAVRQRDTTWALALLPTAAAGPRAELLTLLGPTDRSRAVVDLLRRAPDAAAATALLRDCPLPWTPELGTAALADTLGRSWPASAGGAVRERLDLLGHRLPPRQAPALVEFETRPGLSDATRAFTVRALELLAVRATLHDELRGPDELRGRDALRRPDELAAEPTQEETESP